MPDQQTALGPDDFAALNALSVASLSGKHQADALIAKMTAEEKQSFYGYVNQLPHGLQATRADSAIASGVPGLGAVNAEDVMGIGMMGRAAKGALSVPGIARKAIAVLGEAAPVLKYEVAKTALEKAGVPAPIAMVTAMAVSGYRGNGKKAPAPAEAPAAPPVESRVPANATGTSWQSGAMPTPATSPVESAPGGTAPLSGPPPAAAPVAPPPNTWPDQKALNEEALLRRRAEYQARQAAASPQAAPKPKMTAEEAGAYLQMRVAGKTDAQAKQAIEASRALNDRLNLKTPTKVETKFPKGNRGGSPKDE